MRFDPTSKEHTKSYEKPRDEPKPAAEKTKKGDKSKKNKEQVNFWSGYSKMSTFHVEFCAKFHF